MLRYNIIDCELFISLIQSIQLHNEMPRLCFIACCPIEDGVVYKTGAIAVAAMSRVAFSCGYYINWTQCDYKPVESKGGHVDSNVPHIAPFVCIFDFNSAYPTSIICGNISPESCVLRPRVVCS